MGGRSMLARAENRNQLSIVDFRLTARGGSGFSSGHFERANSLNPRFCSFVPLRLSGFASPAFVLSRGYNRAH